MSNIVSIEGLNAPFNVDEYRIESDRQRELGRTMLKVGVMVMVIDDADRMLVLHHAAKDGVWKEGAAGPSMETARYIVQGINAKDRARTESPMQAWQRSLDEELGMDANAVSDARFYIPKKFVVARNDWNFGQTRDYKHAYYAGISMVVGVERPEVIRESFDKARSRTEEIIDFEFLHPDEALKLNNTRPGFAEWVCDIQTLGDGALTGLEPAIYIEPVSIPKQFSGDIRFAD